MKWYRIATVAAPPEGQRITEIVPVEIYENLAKVFGFHFFNSLEVVPLEGDLSIAYRVYRDINTSPEWVEVPRDITIHPVTGAKATSCSVSTTHRMPEVCRFPWHHICPQVCGGLSISSNLINLCDNCHMTIHRILWWLKNNPDADVRQCPYGNKAQRRLAILGYLSAKTNGTIDKIPNEG